MITYDRASLLPIFKGVCFMVPSVSIALGAYNWAQYNFTAVADYTNHTYFREFDEANNEQYGRDEAADALRQ
jgi:hypothetical protein